MTTSIETDDTLYLESFLKTMGWSQTEAAKQLGISRVQFGNYCRGYHNSKNHEPSILPDAIVLACEALKLGVRLDDIRSIKQL